MTQKYHQHVVEFDVVPEGVHVHLNGKKRMIDLGGRAHALVCALNTASIEQLEPSSPETRDGYLRAFRDLSAQLLDGMQPLLPSDDGHVTVIWNRVKATAESLPIELLGKSGRPSGLHPALAVANTRATEAALPNPARAVDKPSVLLAAFSGGSATDAAVIRPAFLADFKKVAAALTPLFDVERQWDVRFDELRQLGENGRRFDVVELWLHGARDQGDQEHFCLFADGVSESGQWVPMSKVVAAVRALEPRLVVLRSCHSGSRSGLSFAAELQASGIAAVVGVRAEFWLGESEVFMETFHTQLVEGLRAGRRIEHVVQLARIELNAAAPSSLTWFRPVLWVHPQQTEPLFPELFDPKVASKFDERLRLHLDKIVGSTVVGALNDDRPIEFRANSIESGSVVLVQQGGKGDVDAKVGRIENAFFVGSAPSAEAAVAALRVLDSLRPPAPSKSESPRSTPANESRADADDVEDLYEQLIAELERLRENPPDI